MAKKTIQGGYNSQTMPEGSYDDVSTSLNNNNPGTCSVVPGTDSPFQWAHLPNYSNNCTEFSMHKEDTNVLPAMQLISPDCYSAEVNLSLSTDLTAPPTTWLRWPSSSRLPASFTVCNHTCSTQQVRYSFQPITC
jgi:hypothetical protein